MEHQTHIEALADQLGRLSITDCLALTRRLESEWGVSATPAHTPPERVLPIALPAEVQTEFALTLSDPGPNKIAVIKAVRELTGLGLKEAKELVEAAPKLVKDALPKPDADAALEKLTSAGAKANLS